MFHLFFIGVIVYWIRLKSWNNCVIDYKWWYRPKSQFYSLTLESTGAKTLIICWLSASLNPILFSLIFLWALFSFIGEWLFPDYDREECQPLVNFISYSFHYRRRFFIFFPFLPANAEVGGKQGSRVGRRGGRKEDKENVKVYWYGESTTLVKSSWALPEGKGRA